MSNLLKAITFLKSSPEDRFLAISDENSNVIGIEKTYLKDIPNENLEDYLKLHLGKLDQDKMVWIEARKKVGITDKKHDSFAVKITAEAKPVQQVQNVQQIQEPMQHSTNFLGQAVQSQGSNMLMPTATVMEMQRKADRLDDAYEKIAELRKELQEVKHKRDSEALDHKKERNDSDTELRDLRSRLQTAEREKDLAVKEIQNDNKSWMDSPAVSNFLEKAPEMLGNIVSMKTGMPPMGESLGAASNLTEDKQGFVKYVSDNLSDEEVNYLGSICHYLPNESFKNELKSLVIKYANGN